jgi:hypothetical protein
VPNFKAIAIPALAGALVLAGVTPASAEPVDEGTFTQTFLNPCVVFNQATDDLDVSRLSYSEEVEMDFQLMSDLDSENQILTIDLSGTGLGSYSGLNYQFDGVAQIEQDPLALNPSEISFLVEADLVSSEGDLDINPDLISSSAGMTFRMSLTLSPEEVIVLPETLTWEPGDLTLLPDEGINWSDIAASDFELTCQNENWENLTSNTLDNGSGGKGFGDPWNKYAWSMKDFNGKMYVGTKNATYNYLQLQNPDEDVQTCLETLSGTIPSIYLGMACLELFDSNPETDGILGTESRSAEIWGFDYETQQWALTYPGIEEAEPELHSQGFRVMENHEDKLYAGSDLGSFIMGVELGSEVLEDHDASEDTARISKWNFPGSRILVNDGENGWLPVDCEPALDVPGPCNSSSQPLANSAVEGINVSFRALASHDGDLYLGTFNFSGAELWKYESSDSSWTRIAKFNPLVEAGLPFSTTISELKSYDGKLMVGLGFGPSLSSGYLWEYDSAIDSLQVVPALPDAPTASSVFKLFVSESNELYVGLVDFVDGFDLLGYKPSRVDSWRTISTSGFGESANRYVWSMEEFDNKLYMGTFNSELLTNAVPRGSAELWASSDDGQSWQQQSLPLRWSLLNYGIRTMAVGDGQLFLGSASHMLAPDLITEAPGILPGILDLGAGAEVWRSKRSVTRAPRERATTITPMKISGTKASISWNPVSGATGYRIYVNDKAPIDLDNTATSHVFRGLAKATVHRIRLNATFTGSEIWVASHSFKTNGSTLETIRFKDSSSRASNKAKEAMAAMIPALEGTSKVWLELKFEKASSGEAVSKDFVKLSKKRLANLTAELEKAGVTVSSAEIKRLASNAAVAQGKYKLIVRYSYLN